MGKNYGPYIVYMISQLIAKQRGLEGLTCGCSGLTGKCVGESDIRVEYPNQIPGSLFTVDETGCLWRREENIELLKSFCPEGYSMAERHGHFIVGTNQATLENYIGIPGRFLISEQPAGGKTGFSLWQPLGGGEEYYENLDMMDDEVQYIIFGYWIARISGDTLKISDA